MATNEEFKRTLRKLEDTRKRIKKLADTVLGEAYKRKLPWECMWCGFTIPVEGSEEEWRKKINIHTQLCLEKEFPSLYSI